MNANVHYLQTNLRTYTEAVIDRCDATAHLCHFCWPRLIVATHWDESCGLRLPCCGRCGGLSDRSCHMPALSEVR